MEQKLKSWTKENVASLFRTLDISHEVSLLTTRGRDSEGKEGMECGAGVGESDTDLPITVSQYRIFLWAAYPFSNKGLVL